MKKSSRQSKKITPITARMSIAEIIANYPQTMEVFLKYGFHCFGCMGASFENLKQAAKTHGIKLVDLLRDLNKAVKKAKK
jgi:hybrid cluster-associated redox disulfide protein